MKLTGTNSRRLFRNDHLEKNLKGNAVRGGAITVGSRALRVSLRIFSTAVLARILMPEDFGLIGMTVVVSGFVGVIRDGGLLYATIQKKAITHEETSLLFWVNVAIGCFIAILLVCLSPLVAYVFNEPRLANLLCALALPFVIGGFAIQHKALLQRHMQFKKIAVIDVGSMFFGMVAGISFAYADYGYWALALMEIATAASALILSWILLPWIPSLPKKQEGMLSTWKFGSNIISFNLVNYVTRNADNALIGWYWGAASLGLYTRAYSLLMLPIRNINAPFSAVAVPVLSRVASEPSKFKRYFTEGVSLVAAVVIPIVIAATVFAEELVMILLGEKWMQTANLFRLLAVPALLFGASQPISWLYVALDRTRQLRNVGLISAPINVAAFCIGLPYGPEGVALGYTASSCLLYIPVLRYALRETGIGLWDVFGTWKQPLLAAGTSGLVGLGAKILFLPDRPDFASSVAALCIFGIAYASIMLGLFGWKERAQSWYSRKQGPQGVQQTATESAG